jgi:hypothetical protein
MIDKFLGSTHAAFISGRRRDAVSRAVARAITSQPFATTSLLDVGAGDGVVAGLVKGLHPGLQRVEGVEVVVPPSTAVPVSSFDGRSLPYGDDEFDAVMLCDVLHHVPDYPGIVRLLSECSRVARRIVVVKDHPIDTWFDLKFISLLDTIGNWNAGIAMPLTFLSRIQWRQAFKDAGLELQSYEEAPFGIHPPFVRRFTEIPFWSKPYHFVCALNPISQPNRF